MRFDMCQLPVADRYKLMGSTITPRPVAWVTTVSADGVRNAAPYSFFNMMAPDPPLVVLGMMRRADGTHKDSALNILKTREFVVNLVSFADAEAMNATCIDAPPEIDELDLAGIATTPSVGITAPRIASAPVSFECRLFQAIEPGGATTIVLGEVVTMHIADALVDAKRLHVDTIAMDLVGRMHGAGWYTRTEASFQLARPSYTGRTAS